ncbi:hypothetical protein F66182_16642 [Fusarium sp. NRRL 66182]|nr:hypothetical protein F66182_16642 [Fusarium sp. NRRL 66182]
MAQPSPNFESLAATISESSDAITSFLKSRNLPTPSFDENGPADIPKDPEVQGARLQLLGALTDMLHLAMGPAFYSLFSPVWVRNPSFNLRNSLSLDHSANAV